MNCDKFLCPDDFTVKDSSFHNNDGSIETIDIFDPNWLSSSLIFSSSGLDNTSTSISNEIARNLSVDTDELCLISTQDDLSTTNSENKGISSISNNDFFTSEQIIQRSMPPVMPFLGSNIIPLQVLEDNENSILNSHSTTNPIGNLTNYFNVQNDATPKCSDRIYGCEHSSTKNFNCVENLVNSFGKLGLQSQSKSEKLLTPDCFLSPLNSTDSCPYSFKTVNQNDRETGLLKQEDPGETQQLKVDLIKPMALSKSVQKFCDNSIIYGIGRKSYTEEKIISPAKMALPLDFGVVRRKLDFEHNLSSSNLKVSSLEDNGKFKSKLDNIKMPIPIDLIKEEPSYKIVRTKSAEQLSPPKKLPAIGVFWDIENCRVPKGVSASYVVRAIRNAFFEGYREAEFMCVCDTVKETAKMLEELNDAQVNVIHVASTLKNAADDKLLQSMRRFADIHGSGAAVILISGDSDFAVELYDLRYRKNLRVILIHNSYAQDSLKLSAHETILFTEITSECPAKQFDKSKYGIRQCLHVYNLPLHVDHHAVRQRLKVLTSNIGGQIKYLNVPEARISFQTPEQAARGKRRLCGEFVFGNKITCLLGKPYNGRLSPIGGNSSGAVDVPHSSMSNSDWRNNCTMSYQGPHYSAFQQYSQNDRFDNNKADGTDHIGRNVGLWRNSMNRQGNYSHVNYGNGNCSSSTGSNYGYGQFSNDRNSWRGTNTGDNRGRTESPGFQSSSSSRDSSPQSSQVVNRGVANRQYGRFNSPNMYMGKKATSNDYQHNESASHKSPARWTGNGYGETGNSFPRNDRDTIQGNKLESINGEMKICIVDRSYVNELWAKSRKILWEVETCSLSVAEFVDKYTDMNSVAPKIEVIRKDLDDKIQIEGDDSTGQIRLIPVQIFARDLLTILKEVRGRMLLNNFESAYLNRFGVACRPATFGYPNIVALVLSLSEYAVVKGRGLKRILVMNNEDEMNESASVPDIASLMLEPPPVRNVSISSCSSQPLENRSTIYCPQVPPPPMPACYIPPCSLPPPTTPCQRNFYNKDLSNGHMMMGMAQSPPTPSYQASPAVVPQLPINWGYSNRPEDVAINRGLNPITIQMLDTLRQCDDKSQYSAPPNPCDLPPPEMFKPKMTDFPNSINCMGPPHSISSPPNIPCQENKNQVKKRLAAQFEETPVVNNTGESN